MLLKRIDRKMFSRIGRSSTRRRRRLKRFSGLVHAMQHYCANTTLHGLRYVVDRELNVIERSLWLVIFALSSFVASNIICTVAQTFWTAPTSIGIDSTTYKISDVPFPSVTLCPNDRVDWNKALDLEKRIFSNSTDTETRRTFLDMLVKLSTMTFGDFDDLAFLKSRKVHGLLDVNVTAVLLEVLPSCDVLFTDCWWRNSNRNCCEIFEVQKTEYGFCYSFNSEVAEPSKAPRIRNSEQRPRRASGYGDWSGVKVTIHLGNVTKPPESTEIDGVVLMLNEPRVWPNSGSMIPGGSLVGVSLDCVSGYATQPVLELDRSRTPCRYVEDLVYNQETCLSVCKRAYVGKHCGCNPSFLFPSSSKRDCNVEDFPCLVDHNDLFNDYYVLAEEGEVNEKTTMICDCPPECEYYFYDPQFTTVPIYQSKNIKLDVHFAGQTSFRYKTDIIFTNLDLLVSFGGIIGLFLGGSLLSAAELIYYLTVAVFCYLRACWVPTRKEVKVVRPMIAGASTKRVYPVLDYGPIKPRSTLIPRFYNRDDDVPKIDRF